MGRLFRISIVAVVLGLLVIVPVQGADPNLIKNGGFEEGFSGGVGVGWGSFSNGGNASYGFRSDGWEPVLADGKASQLIVIKTGAGEGDRYAGIYQTVPVVAGTTYKLTIHGMVRSTEGSVGASGYGYRLQWAIDYNGGTDWQSLEPDAWHELDWYEWPLDTSGYLETFEGNVQATSGKLTLFIRAWKKWAEPSTEGSYNLDGISLVGTAPTGGLLPPTGAGLVLPVLAGLLVAAVLGVRVYRARRTWL
jgi:hypothetical protein